jgi:hypothetical protein
MHFHSFQICFIIFGLSFLPNFFCVFVSATLQSIEAEQLPDDTISSYAP